MMQWTEENNLKLFRHVLCMHDVKLDYAALAAAMGEDCTAKAITHQIAKIKGGAKSSTAGGTSTNAPDPSVNTMNTGSKSAATNGAKKRIRKSTKGVDRNVNTKANKPTTGVKVKGKTWSDTATAGGEFVDYEEEGDKGGDDELDYEHQDADDTPCKKRKLNINTVIKSEDGADQLL